MVAVDMKIAATLLLLMSSIAWAAPGKGALDKATLEKYLRHVELFRGDVMFKIDDAKPSKYLPGFSEVLVHLIFNSAEKDELFYISADGQTIIRGDVFNLGKSPFQSNLDKLTLDRSAQLRPGRRTRNHRRVWRFRMSRLQDGSARLAARSARRRSVARCGCISRIIRSNPCIPGLVRRLSPGAACITREKPAFGNSTIGIYENQDQITVDTLNQKVLAWAGENGVDTVKLGQCVDTKATEPEVNRQYRGGPGAGRGRNADACSSMAVKSAD